MTTIARVIKEVKVGTYDMGGKASTSDVGTAVAEAVRAESSRKAA